MKISEIKKMPLSFDRYINLSEDMDIIDALEKYGINYLQNEKQQLLQLGDKVYAPDKWSVKDILQHIIDTERIFAYRALHISHSDTTPLPGFDENFYAAHTTAAKRTVDGLLLEFNTVRASTILLFKSFSDDMLVKDGTSSNVSISHLAIGFAIVAMQMC